QKFLDFEHVNRLLWPACSPDMNPFDTLWVKLSTRLMNREVQPTNLDDRIASMSDGRVHGKLFTPLSMGCLEEFRLCTTYEVVKTAGKHAKRRGYAILNKRPRLNCSLLDQ
ncbi:hypothetical protein CAPTEDRAFT_127146, partial [Capitella teleta]